jgi:hypothetical protein
MVDALDRRAHFLIQAVVVDELAQGALAIAHVGQQLLAFGGDRVQPLV